MSILDDLYSGITMKEPVELEVYQEYSDFAVKQIESMVQDRIDTGDNQIPVTIGLRHGIPMENIHRIAAPIVEAWAIELFEDHLDSPEYQLIGVEGSIRRTDLVDVVLSFKRKHQPGFSAQVDVKSTAEDIKTSGKSPNITSFIKIRSAYIEDPDFLFVILSLKHSLYSDTTEELVKQFIVVKKSNAYDLKNLSSQDFTINPALGSGQLQIKDIHYVREERHTTAEFCKILDEKFINCKNNTKEKWMEYAEKYDWIK